MLKPFLHAIASEASTVIIALLSQIRLELRLTNSWRAYHIPCAFWLNSKVCTFAQSWCNYFILLHILQWGIFKKASHISVQYHKFIFSVSPASWYTSHLICKWILQLDIQTLDILPRPTRHCNLDPRHISKLQRCNMKDFDIGTHRRCSSENEIFVINVRSLFWEPILVPSYLCLELLSYYHIIIRC